MKGDDVLSSVCFFVTRENSEKNRINPDRSRIQDFLITNPSPSSASCCCFCCCSSLSFSQLFFFLSSLFFIRRRLLLVFGFASPSSSSSSSLSSPSSYSSSASSSLRLRFSFVVVFVFFVVAFVLLVVGFFQSSSSLLLRRRLLCRCLRLIRRRLLLRLRLRFSFVVVVVVFFIFVFFVVALFVAFVFVFSSVLRKPILSTYVFICYTFVHKTQQAVYTKKTVAFRSNLRNELSWDSRRWYHLQPAEIEIFFYLVVNVERLLRECNFSGQVIATSRGALGKEQSWNERVERS